MFFALGRWSWFLGFGVFLVLVACSNGEAREPASPSTGELGLWLWERPELGLARLAETQGLDPDGPLVSPKVSFVAPLLGTLRLETWGLEIHPRRQPWAVPSDLPRLAVVRIESTREAVHLWDDAVLHSAVDQILHWVERELRKSRGVEDGGPWRGLQIDFDARESERSVYRDLLHRLRRHLDPELSLEITALASWCLGDPWIADLPIDRAVPMFFRMGPEGDRIRARGRRELAVEVCRWSYGVSTDGPWVAMRPGRDLYVFHPRAWRIEDVAALAERRRRSEAGEVVD